jgi:RNA polymerase sigma-70 factor (family 1)
MDKLIAHSDNTLVDLLKVKHTGAFEEIYRRYWRPLYSACYKRVQSREISEEIVQDIFTSLWMNRNTAVIANLSAYLFTAVKYKVINHLSREMSRTNFTTNVMQVQNDNSTEETILLDDLNSALEREIEKLPAKRQMIFRLHSKEHLSVKQVASQMGISEKTVENQYGKALKILKVNLKHFTFSLCSSLLVAQWEEFLS